MNPIEVVPASREHLPIIAELVVESDHYIYDPLDDHGRAVCVNFFEQCFEEKTSVFFSENIYIAKWEGTPVGVIVAFPCGIQYAFDQFSFVPETTIANSIQYIGRGYFDELIDEVKEMRGSYINNVAVLPDARRKGVARAMLEYVIKHMPRPITIDVLANNPAAVAAYMGVGFRKTESFHAYAGRSDEVLECIRMEYL